MRNRNIFLVLVVGLFFLTVLPTVQSLGPNTHVNITLTALNDPEVNDTIIAGIIRDNLDACFSGLLYPDVAIFKYYTNFKEYAGLHNYNTVEELLRLAKNDRERAFAYCWKIHLGQDGISHNHFIPAATKSTKLPNYFIHPVKELSADKLYLTPIANRVMERHREFDDLVERATGKDWSSDADKLNFILGGGEFYSKAFNPESTTTFGRMQRIFFQVIGFFVSEESVIDYYNLALDETKAIMRGETSDLDPSGEVALRIADQSTSIWLYAGTFVFIGLIFFISFKRRWIGFKKGS